MTVHSQSPNLVPRLKQRSVQNRFKVSKEKQRANVIPRLPLSPDFVSEIGKRQAPTAASTTDAPSSNVPAAPTLRDVKSKVTIITASWVLLGTLEHLWINCHFRPKSLAPPPQEHRTFWVKRPQPCPFTPWLSPPGWARLGEGEDWG